MTKYEKDLLQLLREIKETLDTIKVQPQYIFVQPTPTITPGAPVNPYDGTSQPYIGDPPTTPWGTGIWYSPLPKGTLVTYTNTSEAQTQHGHNQ